MKRTNKATTTTMVRRVSAALLAVCITALHLALPVKAATAFTTQQAFAQGVTGYGSTGFSKSIVPADYAGGWRFICGDASYNIRTVEVAVLSIN